jgi:hypothetical protein
VTARELRIEAELAILCGPALAGLELFEFGYFETVRLFPVCRPALAGSGFFEKFVELGGNWNEKTSIPREIRGIGARKFVAM